MGKAKRETWSIRSAFDDFFNVGKQDLFFERTATCPSKVEQLNADERLVSCDVYGPSPSDDVIVPLCMGEA